MDWSELSPVLVGVALLVGYRRFGDLMIDRAVQFHSSPVQKRRAESQRRLAHVIEAVCGLVFIAVGLIDTFLLEDGP